MKTKYPGISKKEKGGYAIRVKRVCRKTGRMREREAQARTLKEARDKRAELIASLESSTVDSQERIHLRDYLAVWVRDNVKHWAESTARTVKERVDNMIVPGLGAIYLDALSRTDVEEWRDGLLDRYSEVTINGALRTLRQALEEAADHDDIALERNVAKRVKALPEGGGKEAVLSADELSALIAAVPATSWWFAPICVLAQTGARFCELSALRWEDVDWDRQLIHFRRSHVKGTVRNRTKTNKPRTVPLTPWLAEILERHRERLELLKAKGKHGRRRVEGFEAGWVFPSRHGTLSQPSAIRKPLHEACIGAEVDRPVSAHWFRYTFNHHVKRLADKEVAKAMTGHVTDEMAEHYDHIEPERKRDAVLRLVERVAA